MVIELKTGDFKPEYAGQLNFYLSVVDGILKKEQDNPSIGLLLCKSKNNKSAGILVALYQSSIFFKIQLPIILIMELLDIRKRTLTVQAEVKLAKILSSNSFPFTTNFTTNR